MNDNRTHTATGKACPQALEFFAGIGLARLGLEESGFQVEWSNDIDSAKCEMYRNNFTDTPGHTLVEGDMSELSGDDLPHDASIAWGSSPCTDLSLAGTRTGLNGKQSGAFWQYVRLLEELGDSRPPIAILENVNGLATSHSGEDLAAAVHAFNVLGYSVDVLSIDTRRFIPQSRPRLFLVGLQNPPSAEQFDSSLRPDWLQQVFADTSLRTHRAPLPAYRRTRNGKAVWEVRADDISGCLRTARGGSSRQAIIRMGNGQAAVRWMTPREYAALMGAAHYNITGLRPNQVMFGFGDAVSVPVVEWLGKHYFMPALNNTLGKDLYVEQTLLSNHTA